MCVMGSSLGVLSILDSFERPAHKTRETSDIELLEHELQQTKPSAVV